MSIAEASPFLASLERLFCKGVSKEVLQQAAWGRFLAQGLPGRDHPDYRYFPTSKLYQIPLETIPAQPDPVGAYLIPEAKDSYLVFVGGSFIREASRIPKGMRIVPLQDASRTYGPAFEERLNTSLQAATDPLMLLNVAMAPTPLVVYIPPRVCIDSVVQLMFLPGHDHSYHPVCLHIFCASHAQLRTLSTPVGDGVHHVTLEGVIETSASWTHCNMSRFSSATHLTACSVTMKEQSTFHHFDWTTAPALSRHTLSVDLKGSHSRATLHGLWGLHRYAQAHTSVRVRHLAPQATSTQLYKGVLHDQSRSSFRGKIDVDPVAQKTEAYQSNHNLVLGPAAIATAEPELEILADDVKASHGVTVSQPDEELLFYLRSRGVASAEATDLLIRGFIQELAQEAPYHVIPI